jgi:SAM-dependent methyltransferase
MEQADTGPQNGEIIRSYSDLTIHAEVGAIIQRHSENKKDIRRVVRDAIPWKDGIKDILDLGCGYGWFEEVMPSGLDTIGGIDCLGENESPFLKAARPKAREVFFFKMTLPGQTGLSTARFDLIVSLYSLYFFPGFLPEIARLLRPGGLFLALTHSAAMLEEGQHYFDFKNLRKVIEHFSAENGQCILSPFFKDIRYIDYPNALVFHRGDEEPLAKYIDFKKEFIEKDVDSRIVREKMIAELGRKGELKFNKNDRIFLART